jgi:hypothetical protein
MIKQILQAIDLYALYWDGDKYFILPVEFYSLHDNGDIKCHAFDSDGMFDAVDDERNFVRLIKTKKDFPIAIDIDKDALLELGIKL